MTIEGILENYSKSFFSQEEIVIHTLYKGKYKKHFSSKNENIEESSGVGIGSVFVGTVVYWILEKIGERIIDDGYEFTKKNILEFLKKPNNRIENSVSDKLSKEQIIEIIQNIKTVLEE